MASRTHNFIRGLGAGYLAIAVNIAYTAVSVPLALHYLGKEQFGLWALAQQIAGYLMILDLGVSSAVSRFIAVLGAAFPFFASFLFSIPPHLCADFTNCLLIITSIAGLPVVFRSLGLRCGLSKEWMPPTDFAILAFSQAEP